MPYSDDELRSRIEKLEQWKSDLADVLDRLGTTDRSRPLSFENIDELIFQLRKR